MLHDQISRISLRVEKSELHYSNVLDKVPFDSAQGTSETDRSPNNQEINKVKFNSTIDIPENTRKITSSERVSNLIKILLNDL